MLPKSSRNPYWEKSGDLFTDLLDNNLQATDSGDNDRIKSCRIESKAYGKTESGQGINAANCLAVCKILYSFVNLWEFCSLLNKD